MGAPDRWDDWQGWDDERMTGVGVWEGLKGHHRLRLRGPPPVEARIELEAAEGWHLQTGRLCPRVA